MAATQTMTTSRQPTTRTRPCFYCPVFNTFWSLRFSASGRLTESRCGRTVCLWQGAFVAISLNSFSGWLMLSLIALSLFNVAVLLVPTKFMSAVLELMPLPLSARLTLLWVAVINVAVSVAFERWVAQLIADVVGMLVSEHEGRRRIKDSRVYRAITDRE